MNIYTCLDMKSEIYQRPFFERNDASATRAFTLATQDPNSLVGQAPEDFAVFRIGTFDDETGIIKVEPQFLIIRGTDVQMKRQERLQENIVNIQNSIGADHHA